MQGNLSLFPSDRLVKLRDAERIIASCFDDGSRPSRMTIIAWIEDGTLSGKQIGPGKNYYVFRSSLDRLLNEITADTLELAA